MDLKQVRYFVAVAEARSFTRASKQLHIAQPPLSRHIQVLEAELGVQLLHRDSRPLQLTEAGRIFYEQALQVLHRFEQMKNATIQSAKGQRQRLSIGFVASTLYGGLPMVIRKLRNQHPDTDFQFLELTSTQQIIALKEGRIDLGFGRIKCNDPLVSRIVLREERLVIALPPSLELAKDSSPLQLESICEETLILYPKEPRPSFADHVLSILFDNSIYPVKTHEVIDLQTALGLVAAEVGVCLIPASARLRNDLVYRLIDDARATSPIILSHRINDSAWYIADCKKIIRDMYAESPAWLDPAHNLISDDFLKEKNIFKNEAV